jgi:AraC family transcriptional activator of tynA and feaB
VAAECYQVGFVGVSLGVELESNMYPRCESLKSSELAFEAWMSSLHSIGCQYSAEDIDRKDFSGWIRPRSICGLQAIEINCNAPRIVRAACDVRFDGDDHYYALFQLAGRSTMIQNDQPTVLNVGDIGLVDSARPVTYLSERAENQWLALRFPRKSLASHFGSEPIGGLHRSATTYGARALSNLVLESAGIAGSSPVEAEHYMNMAIYDLIGALFAGSESPSISAYSDKLFTRICDVIKKRFDDPDLGPPEVASEAKISLRYLQKLFAARGLTCSEVIQSVRLDYAARLLRLRRATKKQRSLTEIAFASGFLDYNNFGRAFRRKFGYPPSSAVNHEEAERCIRSCP